MTASRAATTPAVPSGADANDPRSRRRKLILFLVLLFALVILIGLAIWYLLFRQPIPIPTIPGQAQMPTYATSIYGSERPMGVTVTATGDRIYVGATEGDRLAREFDSGGNEVVKLLPPTSTGSDHTPVYLATDPQTGEIYVSDRPTGSIYIYDASGTYQRQYPTPEGLKGWQPLGLAFDSAGNLYVTDVGLAPQSAIEIDRHGNVVRHFGANENLSFPNGVAVDKNGDVYVTDGNNGRLLVYGQDGTLLAQIGRGAGQGNLGLPRGVAIDGRDQVYVADSTGQTVFVYSILKPGAKRPDFLGSFGTQGVGDGEFQYPNGIAVDGRGHIYVTDSANNRVQIWTY